MVGRSRAFGPSGVLGGWEWSREDDSSLLASAGIGDPTGSISPWAAEAGTARAAQATRACRSARCAASRCCCAAASNSAATRRCSDVKALISRAKSSKCGRSSDPSVAWSMSSEGIDANDPAVDARGSGESAPPSRPLHRDHKCAIACHFLDDHQHVHMSCVPGDPSNRSMECPATPIKDWNYRHNERNLWCRDQPVDFSVTIFMYL